MTKKYAYLTIKVVLVKPRQAIILAGNLLEMAKK